MIYFWHLLLLKLLGATKPVYAPEPHDVGRYIQAEIKFGCQISIAKTSGPIDPGMFSWWIIQHIYLLYQFWICDMANSSLILQLQDWLIM
jgi:hypothetical protein